MSASCVRVGDGGGAEVCCIPRGKASVTEEVERELLRRRKMQHAHIVGVREVFLTEANLCVVMDRSCDGDTLQDYLTRHGPLQENLARWFIQQLMLAIDYLHSLRILGRDICLSNLFVTQSSASFPLLRFCDFSKPFGCERHISDEYIAPEAQCSEEGADACEDKAMADIWSSGVCLFRLLFGFYVPVMKKEQGLHLKGKGSTSAVRNTVVVIPEQQVRWRNGQHFEFQISEPCRKFLKGLLNEDPQKRTTMSDVWKDEWFLTDLPGHARDYNSKVNDLILKQAEEDEQRLELKKLLKVAKE